MIEHHQQSWMVEDELCQCYLSEFESVEVDQFDDKIVYLPLKAYWALALKVLIVVAVSTILFTIINIEISQGRKTA